MVLISVAVRNAHILTFWLRAVENQTENHLDRHEFFAGWNSPDYQE
ncbi:hypothetical protein [Gimesia algae]|nr:hypothetical protein [Gimesia algae]